MLLILFLPLSYSNFFSFQSFCSNHEILLTSDSNFYQFLLPHLFVYFQKVHFLRFRFHSALIFLLFYDCIHSNASFFEYLLEGLSIVWIGFFSYFDLKSPVLVKGCGSRMSTYGIVIMIFRWIFILYLLCFEFI